MGRQNEIGQNSALNALSDEHLGGVVRASTNIKDLSVVYSTGHQYICLLIASVCQASHMQFSIFQARLP